MEVLVNKRKMAQTNFFKMFILSSGKGKVSAEGRTSNIATWKLPRLLEKADNASVSSQNEETKIDKKEVVSKYKHRKSLENKSMNC